MSHSKEGTLVLSGLARPTLPEPQATSTSFLRLAQFPERPS